MTRWCSPGSRLQLSTSASPLPPPSELQHAAAYKGRRWLVTSCSSVTHSPGAALLSTTLTSTEHWLKYLSAFYWHFILSNQSHNFNIYNMNEVIIHTALRGKWGPRTLSEAGEVAGSATLFISLLKIFLFLSKYLPQNPFKHSIWVNVLSYIKSLLLKILWCVFKLNLPTEWTE